MNSDRSATESQTRRRKPARSAVACPEAPDPRLIALVRLLARHAAQQDHEQALRDGPNSAIPEDSSAGK